MRNDPQNPATDGSRLPPLPLPERLQELLFEAARIGRADMIAPLVGAGAKIDSCDPKGYTPFILASYHGHREASGAILQCGAGVDLPDGSRGNTALMGVTFKGHLAIAGMLLEEGANPNATNFAGQTALMMAALFGREDFVDLLLARGALVDMLDLAANSAASLALQQGNEGMARRLSRSCRCSAPAPLRPMVNRGSHAESAGLP
ncbi:ankyrin repeat domain-containing protein [Novosphingobium sp. BL-8H]|uniref:ankyrin repeat domain-containing protein n=1 Tax=Novosphingobium sp. BL-8H TaxID=3127640 RepID=UPI003756BECE